MPLVHHDQAVAIGNGVAHIVGDHHGGQVALLYDPLGRLQHLGRSLGVKRRGVLVQKQQLRLLQSRHQQRQRLTLAAGQQTDLGGHPVFQSQIKNPQLFLIELPVRLGDTGPESSGLAPACRQRKVFLDLHSRGSAHHGVLKHPADVLCPLILRQGGHVHAVNEDFPGVHLKHSGDGVEHGALARAVAADDGDEIALVHGQIQTVQRHLLVHRSGVEGLADIFQLQHRHTSFFLGSTMVFQ